MIRKLSPLCIAAALMLSGCEQEAPADASASGGKAAGEVLGGTISDDMIPLDELTSTSPPAAIPRGDASATGGDAAAAGTGEGEAAPEAETSEDAPAPETAE